MKTTSVVAFLLLVLCSSARGQMLEWTRQLGTDVSDQAHGVSADDSGNVYISGRTHGSLGGVNAGPADAFLAKYDLDGTLQWTRQFGTSLWDISEGVDVDELGNVYISGDSEGSAFLAKYDTDGALQWNRRIPTPDGFESTGSDGVSADGLGNIYIAGAFNHFAGFHDAFVSKFDASGTLHWTQQLGPNRQDQNNGVSADGLGGVYVSGRSEEVIDGALNRDAFVAKYDSDGEIQWTRRLDASAEDTSNAVAADNLGNVFITGFTEGSLDGTNAGERDAYLTKYDSDGMLLWSRQLGTSMRDAGRGVAVDSLGNAFITGGTEGSLEGTNAGDRDAFLTKYDSNGTLQWTQQIGTSNFEVSNGLSVDGIGNVFISGVTGGNLGGVSAGGGDAFLAKFTSVPEPSAFVSLLLGIIPTLILRRGKRT